MGGYGSGRNKYSTTAKIDEGLKLDISKLRRDGFIGLNSFRSGSMKWTSRNTGKELGSIGYEFNTFDSDNMWVRLHYTHTPHRDAEPQKMDYKIRLETTQPNYGGKRLWFICPVTHKRAGVLFSPSGSSMFASRYAFNLKYQSQSLSEHDRAIDKMWRLKNKLGGENYWRKPKGMHHKTHDRMVDEIHEAERICDDYLIELMVRHGMIKGLM